MTIFIAAILGVVEGLTEFLPVSSTGHLILASKLLGLANSDFLSTFEIAIQLGAILAVLACYWKIFLSDRAILGRVIVAFIPTGLVGLALHGLVKRYLLGNESVVLWSLLLGGFFLIGFEWLRKERDEDFSEIAKMPYAHAVVIGLCQAVAIIPGVSRSAATIIGGMALGWKRTAAVQFSFLLAVPTMIAATGLDLFKSRATLASSGNVAALAVGFAVSFVVALATIRFLMNFVKNRTFVSFGVYRIIIAVLFWLLIVHP